MKQNPAFSLTVDDMTIERAKRGDMNAMAHIYEVFSRPCFNLALRITGSPAVAEDIVHDTFIKVIEKIHKYRGDAPLWPWLRRITTNTTINCLNRRKWMRPLADAEDGFGREKLTPITDSGDQAANQHDLETLLGSLDPRSRAVLLLHDLEGMTHLEIAALFGQSESFSKSILSRARKQLSILIKGQKPLQENMK